MENMRSFWQLSDELRGQNKGTEDHKWSMAATKLADQSWANGERFHNLDLSKAPALGRPRENTFHEGSKFENLNFSMSNLDSKFAESVNKNLFINGYDNVNAAYQKISSNSFVHGNTIASKYGGMNHKEVHKKNQNENNLNNVDEKRFKTLPAVEMLPRDVVLGGYIFVCNNDTMQEDLKRLLFGLPPRYKDSVRAITPGLPLFLYNYTTHQLHGIFEAASFGGSNIDPTAWEDKKCKGESRFPAQVRIQIRKICKALEEDDFRPVLHHYDGPKFRLELSVPETLDLMDLCEKTGVQSVPRISI